MIFIVKIYDLIDFFELGMFIERQSYLYRRFKINEEVKQCLEKSRAMNFSIIFCIPVMSDLDREFINNHFLMVNLINDDIVKKKMLEIGFFNKFVPIRLKD